ncbi:hypothetical protein ATANTOWER_015479 [Ataeniobius toweri]|uniref:Uncharacterized protein n=1 Tax=Ataeniobius toweri TaxID=208326 RepID=A0ABU7CH97_9TELE|nr:hypothetical protein [Ataeniobius toweri]
MFQLILIQSLMLCLGLNCQVFRRLCPSAYFHPTPIIPLSFLCCNQPYTAVSHVWLLPLLNLIPSPGKPSLFQAPLHPQPISRYESFSKDNLSEPTPSLFTHYAMNLSSKASQNTAFCGWTPGDLLHFPSLKISV